MEIKFKDGTSQRFPYPAYVVGYEGAFVIIRTESEKKHSFPAQDVREVIETPRPRF
ncbi:hypothetical protein [Cupriavidus sp. H19C3]|uniref:hypothetical protein n=1 Tax=Cupriavidus sp. H19C3 TaxID=3241603 RepID=UPI003BF77D46